MTDIIVGMPMVAVIAMLLGSGWSAVTATVSPGGPLGFLSGPRPWHSLCFRLIGRTHPLGLSVRRATPAVLLVAASGHVMAVSRHANPRPRESFIRSPVSLLLTALPKEA